jgi:hypothetical protein
MTLARAKANLRKQGQRELKTHGVLNEVFVERDRQETKWGEQDIPDGTGPEWEFAVHPLSADLAKTRCGAAMLTSKNTYALITVAETAAALAETDKRKLRVKLIQCAAVFVAWVEKIDRDLAKG